jgi:Domain of unknown function (DUF4338)/Transposase Tn5 dimerisation domain/Transposase DNA-binding
VSGQWFGRDVVERIVATVQAEPTISRRTLSRQVGEWVDLRDGQGKVRDMSVRKALVELERQGAVILPAAKSVANFSWQGKPRSGQRKRVAGLKVAKLDCSLKQLGPIEIVRISAQNRQQSQRWTGVMEKYHYLGSCQLRGAQMRYLIRSPEHGVLGAASFSAATRRLRCREKWIGWSESACRANLQQVGCNSRFLIVASVKVPNLASHVMSQILRRLPSDWHERYGYELLLVETFVDPEHFQGISYRAGNWQHIGETAGREDGFANGTISTGKKQVYVYALNSNARQQLCREPEEGMKLPGKPAANADWVEQELATARIFDGRLRRRMYDLTRRFAAQAQALVPQASNGSAAEAKATYRFFKNPRVTMDAVLKGHGEATLERAREHAVVLAVQDTTFLNYTAHAPGGAGPIGPTQDVGMILHGTIAFSLTGTPLGVLDAQCWARDPNEVGKRDKCHQLPIEEKESVKWLRSYRTVTQAQRLCSTTMFVSVGDRESDIFELFAEAAHSPDGPKLLVRAERTRYRKVLDGAAAENNEYLWERMNKQPVAGYQEVQIPKKTGRPARTAKIGLRSASVLLRPPVRSPLPPVQVWAVYAREVDYGSTVKEPIEWMLLTTVEVSSFEDARERLRWYTLRWGIELFHRILKSGCRIEDRLLDDTDSLKKCLALDLIVAWRIHVLMKASRETPDVPCTGLIEDDEWKVLHAVLHNAPPPKTPPSLRTVVHMIGRLGGFLVSKRNTDPGMITLWRGLIRLNAMVWGARAALQHIAHQTSGPP